MMRIDQEMGRTARKNLYSDEDFRELYHILRIIL